MGLIISTEKGDYQLSKDFKITIDFVSPIYSAKGSQTVPATLPPTSRNLAFANYMNRMDIDEKPKNDVRVTVSDGEFVRSGKQNITSASDTEGIVSNIGFDEGEMYSMWNAVKLKDIKTLPVYRPDNGVDELIWHLNQVAHGGGDDVPYAIFTTLVVDDKNTSMDGGEKEIHYPEYLNPYVATGYSFALMTKEYTLKVLDEGEVLDVKVPKGYGITPFLKVYWILDKIFDYYGYTLVENPFAVHHQLKTMVVLNNVADAIVTGKLDYVDMMPDCTINEFLDSLFARTGMQIFVNGNTRQAKILLIKDILASPPSADWTELCVGKPVVNYESAGQVKLSAKTSLTNASTKTQTYDEFLALCNNLVTVVDRVPEESKQKLFYYEKTTANFYKVNTLTKKTELVSSPFFTWDKKSLGAYTEITGSDECLPMGFSYGDVQYLLPYYLTGAVHKYTSLKTGNVIKEDEEMPDTPLSFAFAIPPAKLDTPDLFYAFGTTTCYYPNGEQIRDKEGNIFDLSLNFADENGAFNRFFASYDAVLRHANHKIDAHVLLPKLQLSQIDTSCPVLVNGQKLLIENLKSVWPYKASDPCEATLRTIKLLKPYEVISAPSFQIQKYSWEIVRYDITAIDAYLEALRQNNPQLMYSVVSKEYLSDMDETEFDYLLPPTEEDVLAGREILNTYQVKILYKASYVDGNWYSEYATIDFQAGIKAMEAI